MPEIVLQDLAIGLVGAAIATAASWLFRFVVSVAKQRRALQRFPIDGMYISEYSDVVEDVFIRTVRDVVTINQNALNFTGTSRNVGTGRTFALVGRIVDGRHLAGTYSGEHSADSGTGVFYMDLSNLEEGRIEGLWAGWGKFAAKPAHGVWKWRRMVDIRVTGIAGDDPRFGPATAIAVQSAGSPVSSRAQLARIADDPDGLVLVSLNDDGRPTGVVAASSVPHIADADTSVTTKELEKLLHHRGLEVGLVQLLAVRETMRKAGIGSGLAQAALRALDSRGCDLAVALIPRCLAGQVDLMRFLRTEGFGLKAELPHSDFPAPHTHPHLNVNECSGDSECTVSVMHVALAELSAPLRPPAASPRSRLLKLAQTTVRNPN